MKIDRKEQLMRLSSLHLSNNDTYYLHYRSLFKDLEAASIHAKGKLLDIGCGNKPYESLFVGRVEQHVGSDIVQSSDCKVDVICPATRIPFDDETFDTVLCTQVIEHVEDHQGLISESYRLLRNEGILILSGPMYWPLHEEPYDFFRFTEYGLKYLLEKVGFEVVSIKSNGGKWATCGQVIVHTFENTRLQKKWITRLLNRFFAWMDDRRPNYKNPMNYVVVAKRV